MRDLTGWLLGALLFSLSCGAASAQTPYSDYQRERAYRHFLNSPYSYRTYSALIPPSGYEVVGPFSYQSYFTPQGYVHQRITPRGFESYTLRPGHESYYITPYTYQYQYQPSVGESYFAPRIPAPRRR